jgi:hypothetical protein
MNNYKEYGSQKPINYNYIVKNFLTKELDMIYNINEYSQIILCVYKINNDGKFPFIQFLLSNNGFDLMTLPILPLFYEFNKETIFNYSKVFLSGILEVTNFEEFNKRLIFDGYYEFEENIYLFFDTTNYEFNINNTNSSTRYLFVLPDEIINHRKVCNIPICNETIQFFIANNSINYLHDNNNDLYEQPLVGFIGKPTVNKLNFTYTFGENPKDRLAILGPYYYFTNFNYAIRQGGWSNNYKPEYIYNKLITDNENGRYSKGGIVRFALFTGITKYIENMPNYPIDQSEIKKQRLNDPTLNKNYEIQTLRISDHDGIWTKTCDSAYLANIELDDGSFLQETPIFVLKEYNQQVPLSYHFINKNTLGNKYDSNNNSYRIV